MNRELRIKNVVIKNRIAIPPMVCFNWSDDSGYVTDRNIEHYKELAMGGAGLVIVEATAVTKRSRIANTELGIWEDGQIEGLRKIVDVIHENGAKTFIQLVHAGGNGMDPQPEAPSATMYRGRMSTEMTQDRIDETISDFVAAALRAKAAGFDGVELHGCHGYLLSCFFNERTNHRTDAYGTDKALLTKQVLKAVKEACGEAYVVGIRLGAFEPLLEHGVAHAQAIAELTDFIDASYGGDCDGYAPEGFPCSQAVYGASCIKQALPGMPVFGVHNINCREDVIVALATGIDMVDVGKASLVDPAFAKHVLEGKEAGRCLHCKGYCRWNPGEMADPNKKCPGHELFSRNR